MNCELSVLPGKPVVLSSLSGPTTIKDRVRSQRETLRFSQKKRIKKILVDVRRQESLANTMDIHDYAATVPETTHGYQVAIVCCAGDTDAKYIETVAKNRGAFIKVFHCFDEALEWLTPRDLNTPDLQDYFHANHILLFPLLFQVYINQVQRPIYNKNNGYRFVLYPQKTNPDCHFHTRDNAFHLNYLSSIPDLFFRFQTISCIACASSLSVLFILFL